MAETDSCDLQFYGHLGLEHHQCQPILLDLHVLENKVT